MTNPEYYELPLLTSLEALMLEELVTLAGYPLRLERDEEAPKLWSVWTADEDSDVIGAGDSASEAIEDARAQVRVWQSSWAAQVSS